MSLARLVCVAVLTGMLGGALAQDRVDARLTRERIILVVPIVGSGTWDDPKRPLFAPKPGEPSPVEAYSWVPTDDGKLAIVMLVGKLPQDLARMRTDARVTRAFRKGEDRKDDLDKELKKLKKDFSLEQLLGGVQ